MYLAKCPLKVNGVIKQPISDFRDPSKIYATAVYMPSDGFSFLFSLISCFILHIILFKGFILVLQVDTEACNGMASVYVICTQLIWLICVQWGQAD